MQAVFPKSGAKMHRRTVLVGLATVPAKTPHWFKDVPTQTIAYYAINLEP
jgi:hypothetical protein